MALGTENRPVRSQPGSAERAVLTQLNLLTAFLRTWALAYDIFTTQTITTLMDTNIVKINNEGGATPTNP